MKLVCNKWLHTSFIIGIVLWLFTVESSKTVSACGQTAIDENHKGKNGLH